MYIGRANTYYNLPQSEWANLFVITEDQTREEVLVRYEAHVRKTPELMAALPKLKGKKLACWCTPEACHGDVLVKLLAEVQNGNAKSERNVTELPSPAAHTDWDDEAGIRAALRAHLGVHGWTLDNLYHICNGSSRKFKHDNITPPACADEIGRFAQWWRATKTHRLDLPIGPHTFSNHFQQARAIGFVNENEPDLGIDIR